MIIVLVEDQFVPAVFEQVRHLLQKPIDLNRGEYTIEQIRDLVSSGRQQLWVGIDEATDSFVVVAVTQLRTHQSGAKHLEIILTGSEPHTRNSWFEDSVDALENFGRSNGADQLIFYGRRGWRKLYERRGYKEYYVAMSKDLNDD